MDITQLAIIVVVFAGGVLAGYFIYRQLVNVKKQNIEEQGRIAAEMLSVLGYNVAGATNGEEAVELLRVSKADLVVLDMIMDPGMDGLDTYKMISELHPDKKLSSPAGFPKLNV